MRIGREIGKYGLNRIGWKILIGSMRWRRGSMGGNKNRKKNCL